MRVILHSIAKKSEADIFELSVSVNGQPPNRYTASFDDSNAKYKYCNVDQELFMQLSDLAVRRFGNCAVYQMELMDIIQAIQRGDLAPQFPIELGTTSFGLPRPGPLKIARNKFVGFLYRLGIYR